MQIIFANRKGGAIAQSVEQWTENPCVPGSIPGGTTSLKRKTRKINVLRVFCFEGGDGIGDGLCNVLNIKEICASMFV